MKKIVAVVLAMVMVLGLATTAFGATSSTGSVVTNTVTPVKAGVYELAGAGESMYQYGEAVTKIELTTVTGKVANDVPMYVPNVYSISYTTAISGTAIANDLFMEVAKANATFALKNNGAWVYLVDIDDTYNSDAIDTAVVMEKFVAPVEVPSCGDFTNAAGTAGVPVYFDTEGNVYNALGGDDWAYMNGQFVSYDAEGDVYAVAHEFAASKVVYRGVDALGHNIPVSVKCSECEKTFDVVGAAKFDNTWVKFVDYTTDDVVAGYYIVLKAAPAASAPAAGETVESAKTFDAGIAMYVGMSVMAAAGSAVVLKKKD